MKFSEFIVKEAVKPQLAATDRDGVIRELLQAIAASGAIAESSIDELLNLVIKREKSGSTGFGKGVAVPHAKSPKLKKLVGAIGRSASGVDFAALDKQPVYTVVLLLSPEEQREQHLAAMNVIFTNLQLPSFRRFMQQAKDQKSILEILDEADQGR